MKLFCHINEYESVAFSVLTPMLLASEKVVLWSPSGVKLQRAIDSGKLPFTLKNITALIESGRIQVAGRQEWFSHSERVDKKTFGSSDSEVWIPAFDGQIARWAAGAVGNVETDEVISLGPRNREAGAPWATLQMRNRDRSRAFEAARHLVESSDEHLGARERWERTKDVEERIHLALRMAKNGAHARDFTGSDLSVYPETQAVRVAALGSGRGTPKLPTRSIDAMRLGELLNLVAAVQPIRSYRDFEKTLARTRPHSQYLEALLFGKVDVAPSLANHLRDALPGEAQTFFDHLASKAAMIVAAAALTAEAMTIALGAASGLDLVVFGALTVPGSLFAARDATNYFGLNRVRSPDGLSAFWYALAHRTDKPRVRQARALLKRVERLI